MAVIAQVIYGFEAGCDAHVGQSLGLASRGFYFEILGHRVHYIPIEPSQQLAFDRKYYEYCVT